LRRKKEKLFSTKRMRIMLVFLLCGVAGAWQNVSAQPVLTPEDAIALALQYNYDIRLAKNDSSVAALDYAYRNAVFLPRLNASLGTLWNNNNQKQEFSDGSNRSGQVATNNVTASVNLNWTLFDGMRMFVTRQKAEQYIRLGELIIKEQVLQTVSDVTTTYYNIVRQKQQLRAVEEQMSLSQTRVELSQRKLEIGAGAKPDLLQSQVDLNAQRAAQLQQQTLIRQLKETLNYLIRPATQTDPGGLLTEYDVIDSIPIDLTLTLDDIQSRLESENPSLQITRKHIDLSYLTLKEIKAERLPTVQFNSAYNFSRVNNDVTLNPALPLFNRNSGFNYGFTASIPILNYRNTHRLIRQEELNIGFQQLYLSNQLSILQLSVLQAYQEFDFQKQALTLEESNILLARENVDILLESYRLGQITYVQLREAQKSLEDAYNRLIAARYNTKVAETELMKISGRLPE
jgi:outer membrane protein TolC